jgi:hypothetical protein
MNTKIYEKELKAANMAKLLAMGEQDIAAGRTRPIGSFLKEFKHAHKVCVNRKRPFKIAR